MLEGHFDPVRIGPALAVLRLAADPVPYYFVRAAGAPLKAYVCSRSLIVARTFAIGAARSGRSSYAIWSASSLALYLNREATLVDEVPNE